MYLFSLLKLSFWSLCIDSLNSLHSPLTDGGIFIIIYEHVILMAFYSWIKQFQLIACKLWHREWNFRAFVFFLMLKQKIWLFSDYQFFSSSGTSQDPHWYNNNIWSKCENCFCFCEHSLSRRAFFFIQMKYLYNDIPAHTSICCLDRLITPPLPDLSGDF